MLGELVVYGLVFVAVMIFMRGKRENLNSIGNVAGMIAAAMAPLFAKADQDTAAAKAAVDSMNQVVGPANAEFQKYSGTDTGAYNGMNTYANKATTAMNSAKQFTDAIKASKDIAYVRNSFPSIATFKAEAESNAGQAKAAAPAVMASAQAAKAAADKAAADKAAADAAKAKQPVPAAPMPAVPVSTPAPVGPSPSMASGSAYAASCSKCLLVNNQLSCSCDVTPR